VKVVAGESGSGAHGTDAVRNNRKLLMGTHLKNAAAD
jgi:hypothetical protein